MPPNEPEAGTDGLNPDQRLGSCSDHRAAGLGITGVHARICSRSFIHRRMGWGLVDRALWPAAGSAVVLFLAALLVLSFITNSLSKTVQASAMNNLDRSLGFVFGLARAAVILSILLIATDWLMDKTARPVWMQKAKTLPAIELGANVLKDLMPDSFIAAEDAAKEAADTAEDALELKRTLDRLTQPTPTAEPTPNTPTTSDPKTPPTAEKPAYDNKERRDMERLLQSTETPK